MITKQWSEMTQEEKWLAFDKRMATLEASIEKQIAMFEKVQLAHKSQIAMNDLFAQAIDKIGEAFIEKSVNRQP